MGLISHESNLSIFLHFLPFFLSRHCILNYKLVWYVLHFVFSVEIILINLFIWWLLLSRCSFHLRFLIDLWYLGIFVLKPQYIPVLVLFAASAINWCYVLSKMSIFSRTSALSRGNWSISLTPNWKMTLIISSGTPESARWPKSKA